MSITRRGFLKSMVALAISIPAAKVLALVPARFKKIWIDYKTKTIHLNPEIKSISVSELYKEIAEEMDISKDKSCIIKKTSDGNVRVILKDKFKLKV